MSDAQQEIEVESQSPNAVTISHFQPRSTLALIVLLILILISAVGNYLLTLHYSDMRGPGPPTSYFIALGLLLAQPCLLSIWLAMGGERLWIRFTSFTVALGGLVLIYLKAFEVADERLPVEIVGIIIGIAVSLSIIILIPLWIYRAISAYSIRLPANDKLPPQTNQFSITHLLIAMTIAAVIVAGTKALLPELNGSDAGPGPLPWGPIVSFLLFFIVTISLLSFLALAVVFSTKQRISFIILASLFFATAPMAAIFMMQGSSLFGGAGWDAQAYFQTYLFLWSVGFTLILVLAIFYLIGYRLEKTQT